MKEWTAIPPRRRSGLRHTAGTAVEGFIRDCHGGATAFAAAAMVIMFLGGSALIGDHLWLVGQRDTLKRAADAASIAAVLEMGNRPRGESESDTEAVLLPIAQRYARANVLGNTSKALQPEDVTVTIDVDRAAGTVDVAVNADLGGFLFGDWLYDLVMPAGGMTVESGTELDSSKIEVVLAIDVTGSMAYTLTGQRTQSRQNSRMGIVKGAAKELVDIIAPDGTSPVAVAVVPWHHKVRLDPDEHARWTREGWVAYPSERHYPSPYDGRPPASGITQTLPADPGQDWKGCFEERSVDGSDAPGRTAEHPDTAPFEQAIFPIRYGTAYQCYMPARTVLNFYQRCYAGPLQDPSRQSVNHYPQWQCDTRLLPILPLSTDKEEIKDVIDDLRPHGSRTYSTLGLLWGRRLLAHQWRDVWGGAVHPVDPADQEYLGVKKAIVLLTDGEDNWRYAPAGQADYGVARADACQAAKDAGILVYVVAAMNPTNISRQLGNDLRACSSASDDPDGQYVFLNNATPALLEQAFRVITKQLLVVRRTH